MLCFYSLMVQSNEFRALVAFVALSKEVGVNPTLLVNQHLLRLELV